jgi:hypothetical protein
LPRIRHVLSYHVSDTWLLHLSLSHSQPRIRIIRLKLPCHPHPDTFCSEVKSHLGSHLLAPESRLYTHHVEVISMGGSNSKQFNYSICLWQPLQRHHRPNYCMPYFISKYSAPTLEYNPLRHPLFPDKSALQAFPRCTPKLIRKPISPTPTQPSVIGFSHVFNTRPGPFDTLFLPHVRLHM